jgi:hypothetical protein
MNAEAGAATYAIERIVGVRDDGQAEEREQLAVEGARRREVAGRNESVSDPIYFHRTIPQERLILHDISKYLSRLVVFARGSETLRHLIATLAVLR